MKVKNSLKSLRDRHQKNQVVSLLQIKWKIISQAIWRRFFELQKYLNLDGIDSYAWHAGVVQNKC